MTVTVRVRVTVTVPAWANSSIAPDRDMARCRSAAAATATAPPPAAHQLPVGPSSPAPSPGYPGTIPVQWLESQSFGARRRLRSLCPYMPRGSLHRDARIVGDRRAVLGCRVPFMPYLAWHQDRRTVESSNGRSNKRKENKNKNKNCLFGE